MSPIRIIEPPKQDTHIQSRRGSSSAGQEEGGNEDPLASFYAQAKEDHDSQVFYRILLLLPPFIYLPLLQWRQTYDSQDTEDEQERLEIPSKAQGKLVRKVRLNQWWGTENLPDRP